VVSGDDDAGQSDFRTSLDRARLGNDRDRALWTLVYRFHRYLLKIAGERVGPEVGRLVSPSDLVFDTVVSAFRKIDQFRGQTEGEFRAWLKMILIRKIARAAEKASRRPGMLDLDRPLDQGGIPEPEASDTTPSALVRKSECDRALHEAIAALPEHYQRAVRLHWLEKRTEPQVAQDMRIPQAAVHGLLIRAMRRLKAAMAPYA